jgi:hypothetical protein
MPASKGCLMVGKEPQDGTQANLPRGWAVYRWDSPCFTPSRSEAATP